MNKEELIDGLKLTLKNVNLGKLALIHQEKECGWSHIGVKLQFNAIESLIKELLEKLENGN